MCDLLAFNEPPCLPGVVHEGGCHRAKEARGTHGEVALLLRVEEQRRPTSLLQRLGSVHPEESIVNKNP